MDPITAELPSDELADEAGRSSTAPVWDLSADLPTAAEEAPLWAPVPPSAGQSPSTEAEDAPVSDSAFDLPSWMAPEQDSGAPVYADNTSWSTTYSLDDEPAPGFPNPVDADPIAESVPEATPTWALPVEEPRNDFVAPAPHVWAMPAAAPAPEPSAPVADDPEAQSVFGAPVPEPLQPPEDLGTPSWMNAPAPSGPPAPVSPPMSYEAPSFDSPFAPAFPAWSTPVEDSTFAPPPAAASVPAPQSAAAPESAPVPESAAPETPAQESFAPETPANPTPFEAPTADPRPDPSEIQENTVVEDSATPAPPAWAFSPEPKTPEFPFAPPAESAYAPPSAQGADNPSPWSAASPEPQTTPEPAPSASTFAMPGASTFPEESEIQENASVDSRPAADSTDSGPGAETDSPEFPYLAAPSAPVWPESDSLQFSWNSPPPPAPTDASPVAQVPAADAAEAPSAEVPDHAATSVPRVDESDSFSRFAPPTSRIQENAGSGAEPAPGFTGSAEGAETNFPEFSNTSGGDAGSGEVSAADSADGEPAGGSADEGSIANAPAPRVFASPEEQAAFLASHAAPAGKPWIPQRRSLPDDELVSAVDEVASEPGATLDAMDELERQLRLREEDAQEFNDWEESMLAVGTPEAIAAVEEVRPKFEGIPTVTSAISVIPPELSGYPAPPVTDLPPQAATHSPLFGEAPYGNARPTASAPAPVAEPENPVPAPVEPEPFTAPLTWGAPATDDPDVFVVPASTATPDAAAPPAPPISVPAPEAQAPVATEPPPLVEPPVTSSTPITSAAPFSWAMPELPEEPAVPVAPAAPAATAEVPPSQESAPFPASQPTDQPPVSSTEPHTFPFAFGDASHGADGDSRGEAAAPAVDPSQPNAWAAPPSPDSVMTDFPPPSQPEAPPPPGGSGESAAELTEDPLPFVLPVATPTTGPKKLDDLSSAGSVIPTNPTLPRNAQSEQEPMGPPQMRRDSGPSEVSSPNRQSSPEEPNGTSPESFPSNPNHPSSPQGSNRQPPVTMPEESGAEPTAVDHRVGRAARLFWLWFAANSSVIGLAFGGVIFSLGMSLRQSIIATLLGVVLSFIPLGLGTLAGKRSGQPTMIVSRAVFGLRGNIVPAIVAVVSRVFWGAALLWVLAASVSSTIVGSGGSGSLAAGQVLILALALPFLVAMIVAFFGYALLARFQLVVSVISGVLVVGLIALTAGSIDLPTALTVQDGPIALVLTGAVLVFSFVGLVWANSSADLARYQRPSSSSGASMLWATFGVATPTFLLIAYGALLAASDPAIAAGLRTDPIATFAGLLPSWYPIPLIAAIALSLLSGIVISIYSGGFALQAAGVRLKRQWTVLIAGVLLFGVASLLATLVGDLTALYRDVATTLAVPVAAWVGIFAADTMIRNRRYDSASLLARGGVYPSVRWGNLSGLFVITAVCWGFTTATVGWLSWQGYGFTALGMPRESDLAASDFGVPVALVLGLLVPITLGIPAVRRQEAAMPGPPTRSLVAVGEVANDRSR